MSFELWALSLLRLAAEVNEVDFVEGLAEEVGAEALEFFDGVGGVEGAGGGFGGRGDGEVGGDGAGGGFGGVDDAHGMVEVVEGGFDEWFQKRVVGTA